MRYTEEIKHESQELHKYEPSALGISMYPSNLQNTIFTVPYRNCHLQRVLLGINSVLLLYAFQPLSWL